MKEITLHIKHWIKFIGRVEARRKRYPEECSMRLLSWIECSAGRNKFSEYLIGLVGNLASQLN